MGERYLSSVEKLLKRKLGTLMLKKVSDPRARMITITKIEVTPDLKEARIGLTGLDRDTYDEEELLQVMEDARSFLRGEIGRTTDIRHIPELQFYLDDSIDKSIKINSLIEKAREEDRNMMNDSEDSVEDTSREHT